MEKCGFTLLELSIVLVIIGLIIGGVVAGQELIRSAERSSTASQLHEFITAQHTFKLKFNALPGDMDNAASYWTTDGNNGNGNFLIDSTNEVYEYWDHMELAEMIKGTFPGQEGSGGTSTPTPGILIPESPIGGGVVFLQHANNAQNVAHSPDSGGFNVMIFGLGVNGVATELSSWRGGAYTPEDALYFDTKLDDGNAGTGRIRGRSAGAFNAIGNCTSDQPRNVNATASYLLTNTEEECQLYYFYDKVL